jgi:hypothetical protein
MFLTSEKISCNHFVFRLEVKKRKLRTHEPEFSTRDLLDAWRKFVTCYHACFGGNELDYWSFREEGSFAITTDVLLTERRYFFLLWPYIFFITNG